MNQAETPLNQFIDFWQGRYDEKTTPWDLGKACPHFDTFLSTTPLPTGTMVVPGCGRAHDAAFFAQKGFNVTAIDYTQGAVEEAQALYGDIPNLNIIQADIFHLPNSMDTQFDYLLEHTCFCAINPKRRDDYVAMATTLLKPEGQIIGVFWDIKDPDGPPFGTTPEILETQFKPTFKLLSLNAVPHNAGGRGGQEYLGHFQKNHIQ